MAAILDKVDEAGPHWLTDVLSHSGALHNGLVQSVERESMSVGQLGSVSRLWLRYDSDQPTAPTSVMLKLPSPDDGSREVGLALGIYESEVRFYQEVAGTVAIRAPRVHWAALEHETGRFTLVLEDVAPLGEPGDMLAGSTVEEASRALRALVDLQAPRWADPVLCDLAWLADPARNQALFGGVEAAVPAFLERFGDHLPEDDIALMTVVAPWANAWAARLPEGPSVVMHGDFRMDNMVFPRQSDEPVAVFDWQTARLGPPLVDVAVYLGGCLAPDVRRDCERELLAEYHAGLVSAGVNGFSFDDLWRSYRWSAFYGLLLSIPLSIQLERTERGDALFAKLASGYAQQARDLESKELLT